METDTLHNSVQSNQETHWEDVPAANELSDRPSILIETVSTSSKQQSGGSDQRDTVKHFVTQLKQVNYILEGLLMELEKNEGKNKKESRNRKRNKTHEHGHVDLIPKTRNICCIKKVDQKKLKASETCLVCQLISLQDRIDTLINKKLLDANKNDVKELQTQHNILKEQLQKLIEKCDSDVIEDSNSDERKSGKYRTDKDDGDGERRSRIAKPPKPPQGVFFNCLNELLILVKSLNCITSPGTFWQKPVTDVPQSPKRKRSKCCDRDYPHMHGELNGVGVILKLYPSKKKEKEEPQPEPVELPAPEEEPEEEEEEEEDVSESSEDVESFDAAKAILEDDVSTESDTIEEEDEEGDEEEKEDLEDDDEGNEDMLSAEYDPLAEQPKKSQENQKLPGKEPSVKSQESPKRSSKDESRDKYRRKSSQQGSGKASDGASSIADKPRKESLLSQMSKSSKYTQGSRISKKSSRSNEFPKKEDKDETAYEEDEDIPATKPKKPRREANNMTHNTEEPTLTLILDKNLGPFISSKVTNDEANKQNTINMETNELNDNFKEQLNEHVNSDDLLSSSQSSDNIKLKINNSINENDTIKKIKTKPDVKNYNKSKFTIAGKLNRKTSNEYFDDKKIIIKGLSPRDIIDCYFKNNKNLLFNIKPCIDNVNNHNLVLHKSKSIASDLSQNQKTIFIHKNNCDEDLSKCNNQRNGDESKIDYFHYNSTSYDKIENNLEMKSSTVAVKKSSTTISNYESGFSNESNQTNINEKYSFDYLLDSVLQGSESGIFKSNGDKSSVINNTPDYIKNKNKINRKIKKRKKKNRERSSSRSQSSCSVKLKVVKNKSKIEIGMNASRSIIKKQVNNEKLPKKICKRKRKKKKYTSKCDQSTQYTKSSDSSDANITANKSETIARFPNDFIGDNCDDRKNYENKNFNSNNENNEDIIKCSNTSGFPSWNWGISKPEVRQLEVFLNLVNETQKLFLGNSKNKNYTTENCASDGDRNLSINENDKLASGDQSDISSETSLDSSDCYKSCDDTCYADFLDALSTSSRDRIINISTTVSSIPSRNQQEKNFKKLLKKEVKKCDKIFRSFNKNEKCYFNSPDDKIFYKNDFIIRVSPDDLASKKNNEQFNDDIAQKEDHTDKNLNVKFCPVDKNIIDYLYKQQCSDTFFSGVQNNEIMPIAVDQDIICANMDFIGDNQKRHKNCFCSPNNKFTKYNDNVLRKRTDINKPHSGRNKIKTFESNSRNKKYGTNYERDRDLRLIPNTYRNEFQDFVGVGDAFRSDKSEKLNPKFDERFVDGRPRVVWEDEIEEKEKQEKSKIRFNSKLNSFVTSNNLSESFNENSKNDSLQEENENISVRNSVNLNNTKQFDINHTAENDQQGKLHRSSTKVSKKIHFKTVNLRDTDISNNLGNNRYKKNEFLKSTSTFKSEDSTNEDIENMIQSCNKGILKKTNRIGTDSDSENELSLSIRKNLMLINSKKSDELDDIILTKRKNQKKFVTFTIPADHKQTTLLDKSRNNVLSDQEELRKKHPDVKDDDYLEIEGTGGDTEKSNELENGNDEYNAVSPPLNHAQFHLFPLAKMYAKCLSMQQQIIVRFSKRMFQQRKYSSVDKLAASTSTEYISVPLSHSIMSYKNLTPAGFSDSLDKIKNYNKCFATRPCTEQKGYVTKLEVDNVLQYHYPILMNFKNSKRSVKFKNIIYDEEKCKIIIKEDYKISRSNHKKSFLTRSQRSGIKIGKKDPLNIINKKSTKSVVSNKSSTQSTKSVVSNKSSTHQPNVENDKICKTQQFFDYLNDIRENILEVDDKYGNDKVDFENSKILFDISTRPDAILSITAQDSESVNKKPRSVSKTQSSVKKSLSFNLKGRSSSTSSSTNDNDSNSTPNDLISTDNFKIVTKMPCNDSETRKPEYRTRLSTINIALSGVMKRKFIKKCKKINLVGRIIQPNSIHRRTESNTERSTFHYNSVEAESESSISNHVPEHELTIVRHGNPDHKLRNPTRGKFVLQKTIKEVNGEEESALSRRKNILKKYTYIYSNRFSSSHDKKEYENTATNNSKKERKNSLDNRPPFMIYASRHHLNERKVSPAKKFLIDKNHISCHTISDPLEISTSGKKLIRRPHSYSESIRRLPKVEIEKLSPENNLTTNENKDSKNKIKEYSKSLDALNLQQKDEINQEKLNEVIYNDDITYSMKNTLTQTMMDEKTIRKQQKIEPVENESNSALSSGRKFALKNNTISRTLIKNDKKVSATKGYCQSIGSSAAPSRTSILKTNPDARKSRSESQSDKHISSDEEITNSNEFINLNDTHIICPVREKKVDDSTSEKSYCSTLKLKSDPQYIENMKSKIDCTFPEESAVKRNLLDKVCRLHSSSRIKPFFQENDPEKVDCFGAPIIDDLDISYYNDHGKPIVNIFGCKIYDSNGIPKRGAYGKPIHSALREKLNVALKKIKINSDLPERNKNFEEDLLNVLNTFSGLKTDLYGRIYDAHGRPLFDRFGYLLYDANGNPLTDAYNRALHDKSGRPLITQTTCNFTNIRNVPPLYRLVTKKLSPGERLYHCTSTEKVQDASNPTQSPRPKTSPTRTVVVKKQVSFAERTRNLLSDANKATGNEKSGSSGSSNEDSNCC